MIVKNKCLKVQKTNIPSFIKKLMEIFIQKYANRKLKKYITLRNYFSMLLSHQTPLLSCLRFVIMLLLRIWFSTQLTASLLLFSTFTSTSFLKTRLIFLYAPSSLMILLSSAFCAPLYSASYSVFCSAFA